MAEESGPHPIVGVDYPRTLQEFNDWFSSEAALNYFGQFWDSEDGRNAADLGVVSESWLYPSYSGKALLDVELPRRWPE